LFALLCLAAIPAGASEIGLFAGGYSRDSDIQRAQEIASPSTWFKGERSFATYVGLDVSHEFILPVIEFEHTLGLALGADKSARPNSFIYSSNAHLILPVAAFGLKPFVGAGLGLIYNYGEEAGLGSLKDAIGSSIRFQFNVGGGTKIRLADRLWLRLSLRDYIIPNYRKVVQNIVGFESRYDTVKKVSHNIAFSVGLNVKY
jgi:hypothetical protein